MCPLLRGDWTTPPPPNMHVQPREYTHQGLVHASSSTPPPHNNPFLRISPRVADALVSNAPIVALESTIITHGMPYPDNLRTANEVEAVVRAHGTYVDAPSGWDGERRLIWGCCFRAQARARWHLALYIDAYLPTLTERRRHPRDHRDPGGQDVRGAERRGAGGAGENGNEGGQVLAAGHGGARVSCVYMRGWCQSGTVTIDSIIDRLGPTTVHVNVQQIHH